VKIRIGLGLARLPFSDARAFWRFVERCEASDLDSLWQTDRLVSAVPQLEPLSVMAALAGATERLKFGMNVAVVSFRDPLVLAKECTTIDFLSDGRLLPAFGVGPAIAPEWAATGRPHAGSGRRADEALEIMARLWAGERLTLVGEHHRYAEARIAPLPAQQPLPLWIGGSSPAAIRRTARLGTGWLGGVQSPEQVGPVIAAIRDASAAAGRPIDPDHYGATIAFRFGSRDEPLVQATATRLAPPRRRCRSRPPRRRRRCRGDPCPDRRVPRRGRVQVRAPADRGRRLGRARADRTPDRRGTSRRAPQPLKRRRASRSSRLALRTRRGAAFTPRTRPTACAPPRCESCSRGTRARPSPVRRALPAPPPPEPGLA
jgi:alkanesulfonate monooxygenase SsuD/methylene tetrahydromethanopterin reductase-like flavin-dependent oxidoreductase (luciferase family)